MPNIYFKVKSGSELYTEYFRYKREWENALEKSADFANKYFPGKRYWAEEHFEVFLTNEEVDKYKNQLLKKKRWVGDGFICRFSIKSEIGKLWEREVYSKARKWEKGCFIRDMGFYDLGCEELCIVMNNNTKELYGVNMSYYGYEFDVPEDAEEISANEFIAGLDHNIADYIIFNRLRGWTERGWNYTW